MHSEVESFLSEYVAAWNTKDALSLEALWDSSATDIYYVAEEIDQPFYALTEVRAYWQKTFNIVQRIRMTTADIRTKALAEDVRVVTYSMHMDAVLRADEPDNGIGVDVRVSAILQRGDEGWRFIHYVEAPLGALPYVRKAYRENMRR